MNKIRLIFQNKVFRISLLILSSFLLLTAGFFLGQRFNLRAKNEKAVAPQNSCQEISDESEAILGNQAQLIGTSKETFDKDNFGLYSPLLEGKEVEIANYKYRKKSITLKSIKINDFSGVEIWEYNSPYVTTEGPEDFATFGGYENYLHKATLVSEIKKDWKEAYKTKNGNGMFYGYEYTPKTIGVVSLNSYQKYFPNFRESKPTLVRIWYSKIDGVPTSKTDPLISKVKIELNKIADTFVFGSPE